MTARRAPRGRDLTPGELPAARPETSVVRLERPLAETRIVIGDHTLTLERTAEGGIVRLLSPDGAKPLEIEVTPSGPVLRLGSGLAIAVAGKLDIAADEVALSARRDLSLRSEGTLHVHAAGDLTAVAEAHHIAARLGDVEVEANDDVILNGERIRMNC